MNKLIVITGPTGIGKTKLSIELAKKLNAEIINADSVAIYKKLNIASAKVTKEEMENIPHHLIDIKEPTEEYSVYNFQIDVRNKIKEITSRNKNIIIVGGTGLYIKAALYDYNFSKEEQTDKYDNLSNEILYQLVKDKYPTEDIHINNKQRMIRLLKKEKQHNNQKNKLLYPSIFIGLTTSRENLYKIINSRVDKMFENNLLEEINYLRDFYNDSRILKSAIGYKEFINYFINIKTIEEVKEEIKLNSRRFAKRQYTFFNNQFNIKWFESNLNNFTKTTEEVLNYIKKEL